MLPNAFIGKPRKPSETDLAQALGPKKGLWDRLQADLSEKLEVTVREWKSYSPKAGWALRLKRGKRAIVYLSPHRGGFSAAIVLGDKAVGEARRRELPRSVIAAIDGARRYPEGTAVRIALKNSRDLQTVMRLAAIKIES